MTNEERYIDFLIKRCISLKKSKSVFISYYTYNEDFIQKLVNRLINLGAKDIYLECIDPFYEHDLLKKMSIDEIKGFPLTSRLRRNRMIVAALTSRKKVMNRAEARFFKSFP